MWSKTAKKFVPGNARTVRVNTGVRTEVPGKGNFERHERNNGRLLLLRR